MTRVTNIAAGATPGDKSANGMLRTARAFVRLIGIVAWTLTLLVIWVAGSTVLVRAPRRRVVWRGLMTTRWARGIAAIIGMRVTVTGPAPRGPFILVANHLSYFDVILIQTQLRATFVAKSEVRSWPAIGWLASSVGTIFIDRRRLRDVVRIDEIIRNALKLGDGIVFFPEGTSSNGDRVLPFKAALLDIAARRGDAVYAAAISYRTPPGETPAHLSVCWWGDMTFADHLVNLLKLPWFEATLVFARDPVIESDRKVLARKLARQVQLHFSPVVSAEVSLHPSE